MQRTAGLTPIKLSIVLIIIGLVIGGVLIGQDMTGVLYQLRLGMQ